MLRRKAGLAGILVVGVWGGYSTTIRFSVRRARARHRGDPAVRRRKLKRFQAKWTPVRVKKTRQIKNLEPRFDSIETEKALAPYGWRFRRRNLTASAIDCARTAASNPIEYPGAFFMHAPKKPGSNGFACSSMRNIGRFGPSRISGHF